MLIGALLIATPSIVCQDLFGLVQKSATGIPYIHRDRVDTMKFIPSSMDEDFKALINDKADYVTYEEMFTREYLMGLHQEMQWIEEHYAQDFIDSQLKRNSGDPVEDGDLANYHRVSRVYWLTFLKPEDFKYLPHTILFKEWVNLVRAAINKQLPEGFEVGMIEEQYLHY